MSIYNETIKVTVNTLKQMKQNGQKIAMVTCYDYSSAKILDSTSIDAVLVGDSAANVMAGYETTLPITLDEMIIYAASVVRGCKRAMVVVDMPFGTYQGDAREASKNAVEIMKRTGAQAVKIEGGKEIEESYKAILATGIPIMAHLGLTPQSINKFGGYGLRAKEDAEAEILLQNALLAEKLGCFSVVLEKIPTQLAEKVTQSLQIPTIGIGAGNVCDGQVLVFQDVLGINEGFKPKFLRKYSNIAEQIRTAINNYSKDVKSGDFPNAQEQY